MKRIFGALVAVAISMPKLAFGQVDSMELANELGTVLGAEAGCGLKYNQDAIKAFIEAKVKASDMQFPSLLSAMSRGTAMQFKQMSESEKTAFCSQVTRVAKANKFIN